MVNLGRVRLEKQNIQVIQGDNETITISVASTTSHEAILTGNLTKKKTVEKLHYPSPFSQHKSPKDIFYNSAMFFRHFCCLNIS